jgi:hypothetical protein
MSRDKDVLTLPVYDTRSEEFRQLARLIELPRAADDADDLVFTPAFGRLEIGNGSIVDISHLHIPPLPDPLAEARHRPLIDRHLDSEEVWLVTRGELVMGMAESAEAGDTVPSVHEFRLFHVREGEMFVLPRGRWHGGIWGARPNEPAEFLMFLSGHRAGDDGELVDHIMESYPEDVSVRPSAELPAAV